MMRPYDAQVDLQAVLMGGGHTEVPPGSTPVERFLYITEHGINWSAPEGARSTCDAFQAVTPEAVVAQAPDALARYAIYAQAYMELWLEEPNGLTIDRDPDETLEQMASILEALHRAHQDAGQPIPWTAAARDAWFDDLNPVIDEVLSSGELEEDDPEDLADAFDRFEARLRALALPA